jgi:hypothetical protein
MTLPLKLSFSMFFDKLQWTLCKIAERRFDFAWRYALLPFLFDEFDDLIRDLHFASFCRPFGVSIYRKSPCRQLLGFQRIRKPDSLKTADLRRRAW